MEEIIKRNRNADIFLHLGDGADSFLMLCERMGVFGRAVKGNCDSFLISSAKIPDRDIFTICGKKIFMTHGNAFGVSYSTERLIYAAREAEADIVLYGHTHVKDCRYIEENEVYKKPLYIMNPGSIAKPRDNSASFGYIDINEKTGVFVSTSEYIERGIK